MSSSPVPGAGWALHLPLCCPTSGQMSRSRAATRKISIPLPKSIRLRTGKKPATVVLDMAEFPKSRHLPKNGAMKTIRSIF